MFSSRTLLGLTAGLVVSTFAVAQTAEIEEVIVNAERARSAARLDVPFERLPVNVPVVEAELVEDLALQSQRDALQFHAAVDDKRVRGFNSSEFFRNGFIHLSDAPAYTIERMEIVRGPSAVLNGPVTPGGAINVISKKANIGENQFSLGSFWGVSDNNRDNRGINVDLNFGNLGGERDYGSTAAARLVAGWQGDTGFASRVDNDSYAILPSFQWRPAAGTVIDVEYYRYSINTDRADRPMAIELSLPGPTAGEEIPLALAYDIDPRSSWFGENTDIEESLSDASVALTQELGERFTLNLAYNKHGRDFEFGPGNRPRVDIFYVVTPNAGVTPGSTNPADYRLRRLTEFLLLENDIDQVSALLHFRPGVNHRLLFGADLYDQDQFLRIQRPRLASATSGFFFEFFNPGTVATDTLAFNPSGQSLNRITVLERGQTVEQSNFFVNYFGSFFDERLNLLLGLYQSDIEITRTNLLAATPTRAVIAKNDELLLQTGIVFEVSDQVALYANYAESQLPDLNDPDFSIAPPIRLGEQYEAGVRLKLLEDRLTMNLGYFQIKEELRGETTRQAEVDGVDFDLSWQVAPDWITVLSYAHADTNVTASSNLTNVGRPLVDEVPHKAALWSKYDFKSGSLNGLSIGTGFSWTGAKVRPTAGAADTVKVLNGRVLRYEPETRLDIFANYKLPTSSDIEYELSLNVRNLTREANISNVVPRVPLQGGVRPDGSPYVFDGSVEVMLGLGMRF